MRRVSSKEKLDATCPHLAAANLDGSSRRRRHPLRDTRGSAVRTQPGAPQPLEGPLRRRDERHRTPLRLRRPRRTVLGPGSFASGAYGVSSTIFLFPEGDPDQSGSTRLDSPFGLFLAGSDLEADGANYLSFELRNDRHFRIAEHSGGKTRDLVPWTEHDAVVTMGAEASGPVKNVLAVDVRGDRTVFYLNDTQIAELPGERVALDGVVGVRAGAGLSIHVTEVDIGPNRRGE